MLLGGLAQRLRQRGHAPQPVAHFMTRLLFCLFAEDIGLLPGAAVQPTGGGIAAVAGGLSRFGR